MTLRDALTAILLALCAVLAIRTFAQETSITMSMAQAQAIVVRFQELAKELADKDDEILRLRNRIRNCPQT